MYILAHTVRLGNSPSSSREPEPCPDGNKNHPTFPPSLLLCVLISAGWQLVHVDSPLYVNMLLHISLGKHRVKTEGSTADTEAHQLNAGISVIDTCRIAGQVLVNNTENVVLYISKIMPSIKMFLLSSIAIKSFSWGSFLLCHMVYRK